MKTYGFSVDQLVNQVNPHIEVNKNLYDQLKQNIQSYENNLLPGGSKKNNESYDQCAKRETKEETDVEIYELDLVTIYQGFRVFSDGKVETSNNNKWFSIELRDLEKYDLMDSLKEFKSIIVEKINSKFHYIKSKDRKKKDNNKKRKLDQVSNYKMGHDFEFIIRQKLNLSDIIANEVKVNQDDSGIDIIATYKNNFVLIQYKSIEKPITIQTM
ncbi:hypothetical protein C2G38_2264532 [Gigaspora rosea]|uniref:Nudix hydrolase domain-containing protein n=1 Tax=Gigaspora rosea TaxID=44941 RepID=A0A397UJR1_9GLOM|nr:hypothetical protein C2G38_2264532 [Gigaspora rosea]